MSNIFQKLGIGIADFGKWFASAVKDTASLAAKIQAILAAEQPLQKPFVSGLSTVVADVEALIASSSTAGYLRRPELPGRLPGLSPVPHPHRGFQKSGARR